MYALEVMVTIPLIPKNTMVITILAIQNDFPFWWCQFLYFLCTVLVLNDFRPPCSTHANKKLTSKRMS